jgi:autotransporter-associated beta strand protein
VVEVDDIPANLSVKSNSAQVARYLAAYGLVLVTNYRDFVLLGRDAADVVAPQVSNASARARPVRCDDEAEATARSRITPGGTCKLSFQPYAANALDTAPGSRSLRQAGLLAHPANPSGGALWLRGSRRAGRDDMEPSLAGSAACVTLLQGSSYRHPRRKDVVGTITRSLAAALAIAASFASGAARAQSDEAIAQSISLLSSINTLPGATYQQNLQTAISINNGATDAQREQAYGDALSVLQPTAVSDGLGVTLNQIFSQAIGTPALADANSMLTQAGYLTALDANVVKSYFGTNNNAYGVAYNSTANPNGNPRPFQVSSQIQLYNNYGMGTGSADLTTSPAFPSGHTSFGYGSALLLAIMVPEQYQQLMARAAEYGNSRIVLGVHYPLDVIGGRIIALKDIVGLLANDPAYAGTEVTLAPGYSIPIASDFAGLVTSATSEVRSALQAGCGTSIAVCAASQPSDRFSNAAANQAAVNYALTYGLAPVGPTNLAPVVPANAQLLLATRFDYLSAAQRTDVLASTELPSGAPLDDGTGWARLNLYAAAGGYGAFASNVTVAMDASKGGFDAADTWSNNISGPGGLTKQGSGSLSLTGNNSYRGGTEIDGGRLVAASRTALGVGNVLVKGGTLALTAPLTTIVGNYQQTAAGTLEFDITASDPTLSVGGSGDIDGLLVLDFLDGLPLYHSDQVTLTALDGLSGDFSGIDIEGITSAFTETIVRTADSLEITVAAVPEPAGILPLLAGMAGLSIVLRRRESRLPQG